MTNRKFRKIDNFNLSFTTRHTLKIMSTGSEKTRKLELFSQTSESCLEKNRFKSIFQSLGEILRQFSRINENKLSLYTDVLKYPGKSPRIFLQNE